MAREIKDHPNRLRVPSQAQRAAYPAPESLRTASASTGKNGDPFYDAAYLRRLRDYMREALLNAEQASVDYNHLSRQIKDHSNGDAAQEFIRSREGHGHIRAAYDECVFHRDWAMMYANALQAELAYVEAIRSSSRRRAE